MPLALYGDLQELLVQNSSYKAQLQQRDAELKAQQELLDQQGHDLACCQDMLQVRGSHVLQDLGSVVGGVGLHVDMPRALCQSKLYVSCLSARLDPHTCVVYAWPC